MNFKTSIALVAAIALMGCDGSDPDPGGTDAGPMIEFDAGEDTCPVPMDEREFGASEGSKFLPFTLNQCDGTPYSFYGETEGYCDASFTVVSIAAGWCGPCRTEARLMEEFLVQRYAEHNVRVVVAIVQNNDGAAADATFCSGWTDQYGLTNPVLLDPSQDTQIYFPGDALPANLIVDNTGTIVHREYGASDDLETIRAVLDDRLGL